MAKPNFEADITPNPVITNSQPVAVPGGDASSTSPTGSTQNTSTPATVSTTSTPEPSRSDASSTITTSTTPILSSSSFSSPILEPESTDTPTVAPSGASITTKDNGLIAGIAVLSVILLLALATLGFLFFRRRRRQSQRQEGLLGQQGSPVAMEARFSSVTPITSSEKPFDPSKQSLEAAVASLENQLHEKDTQLRENQATLLSLGRRPSSSSFSDKQARERFEKLFAAIQVWVTQHFEGISLMISPSSETINILMRTQPDYDTLLKDPKGILFVLRGLVADILCRAFTTGQLLGNEAYWELRQAIDAKASPLESNEWRSLTMKLLEKTSNHDLDRAESIDEITQQIEYVISDLTGSITSRGRKADLVRIIEAAAKLAVDTTKQRALYKLQMPTGALDPQVMDAVSVDGSKATDLDGKSIRAAIFPSATRWGNEKGIGYERDVIIFKTQVLV